MKRNRIIWSVLWILSLVGISFFGGSISYGFFAVMTLIPVISGLYLLLVSVFFRIYQDTDGRNMTVGETVPFYFRLMNEFHFAFVSLKIIFFSSFSAIRGLDETMEYELFPGTGIKKETELLCRYRGDYEIGIKEVIIEDYFRLFRIRIKNRETMRVMVRPALTDLGLLRDVDTSNMMRRESSIDPSEPDVLTREYAAGDDIRQISWKVSARSGKLMVRKMIGEEKEGIAILMGTERFSERIEDYLPLENKMLECAIALALYCHKKNIPIAGYYMEKELMSVMSDGRDQFDTLYDKFSDIRFDKAFGEDMLMAEVAGNHELYDCRTVFIVIHKWSEYVTELLTLLGNNNIFTIIYLIGNEEKIELPREQFPRALLIQFSADAELKEVM
ncbi:MAG: DUF58 domain-containing protein [Lachnospiraceae bacterium]|nr:DUF58 domain-containing protein [Lachnospiraceae bacterium]